MKISSNFPPIDQIFNQGRTANGFLNKPVSKETLIQIYELAKMGPTSMNAQPARYIFLTTKEAKELLIPALMDGNVDKTRKAPVTVIVAIDTKFYEFLPKIFPHQPDAASMFIDKPEAAAANGQRNGSLSGAYFILAARGLGLDCGPMSGFDAAKVNRAFFPDGRWQTNFLINLGYGDHSLEFERQPRLKFDEVAKIL